MSLSLQLRHWRGYVRVAVRCGDEHARSRFTPLQSWMEMTGYLQYGSPHGASHTSKTGCKYAVGRKAASRDAGTKFLGMN